MTMVRAGKGVRHLNAVKTIICHLASAVSRMIKNIRTHWLACFLAGVVLVDEKKIVYLSLIAG